MNNINKIIMKIGAKRRGTKLEKNEKISCDICKKKHVKKYRCYNCKIFQNNGECKNKLNSMCLHCLEDMPELINLHHQKKKRRTNFEIAEDEINERKKQEEDQKIIDKVVNSNLNINRLNNIVTTSKNISDNGLDTLFYVINNEIKNPKIIVNELKNNIFEDEFIFDEIDSNQFNYANDLVEDQDVDIKIENTQNYTSESSNSFDNESPKNSIISSIQKINELKSNLIPKNDFSNIDSITNYYLDTENINKIEANHMISYIKYLIPDIFKFDNLKLIKSIIRQNLSNLISFISPLITKTIMCSKNQIKTLLTFYNEEMRKLIINKDDHTNIINNFMVWYTTCANLVYYDYKLSTEEIVSLINSNIEEILFKIDENKSELIKKIIDEFELNMKNKSTLSIKYYELLTALRNYQIPFNSLIYQIGGDFQYTIFNLFEELSKLDSETIRERAIKINGDLISNLLDEKFEIDSFYIIKTFISLNFYFKIKNNEFVEQCTNLNYKSNSNYKKERITYEISCYSLQIKLSNFEIYTKEEIHDEICENINILKVYLDSCAKYKSLNFKTHYMMSLIYNSCFGVGFPISPKIIKIILTSFNFKQLNFKTNMEYCSVLANLVVYECLLKDFLNKLFFKNNKLF